MASLQSKDGCEALSLPIVVASEERLLHGPYEPNGLYEPCGLNEDHGPYRPYVPCGPNTMDSMNPVDSLIYQ